MGIFRAPKPPPPDPELEKQMKEKREAEEKELAKKKAEELEDKVKDLLGQGTSKKKEKSESELEVAEEYPNFNPSAEGESPLEYRGEDIEDDLELGAGKTAESITFEPAKRAAQKMEKMMHLPLLKL